MGSQEQTEDSAYFSFSSPVLTGSLTGPPSTKRPSTTGKQHPLEPQKQVRKLEDLDNFQPQETRERKDTEKDQRWGTLFTFALLTPLPELRTASRACSMAKDAGDSHFCTQSILQAWMEAKAALFFGPFALTGITALTSD